MCLLVFFRLEQNHIKMKRFPSHSGHARIVVITTGYTFIHLILMNSIAL